MMDGMVSNIVMLFILFPITSLQVVIMVSTNVAVSHLLPLVLLLLPLVPVLGVTPLMNCTAGRFSVCSALTAYIHAA